MTVLSAALALACGVRTEKGGEPALATEDVAPRQELNIEEDQQEAPRKAELTGIMPGDFPADLPLHLPASLIDFSSGSEGARTVTLLSPHSAGDVRASLETRLDAAGWRRQASAGGEWSLEKGARRARLRIEDAQPGTRYLYSY